MLNSCWASRTINKKAFTTAKGRERKNDMLLKQFFLPKIAHSSWLLAGDDTCAVIDPQRDVDLYIREAGIEIPFPQHDVHIKNRPAETP